MGAHHVNGVNQLNRRIRWAHISFGDYHCRAALCCSIPKRFMIRELMGMVVRLKSVMLLCSLLYHPTRFLSNKVLGNSQILPLSVNWSTRNQVQLRATSFP